MSKIFFLAIFLVGFSHAASTVDLANKSIAIGTPAEPNPFATCVAQEALRQTLSKSFRFVRLSNAFIDFGHAPVMKAWLVFVVQYQNSNRADYVQVEMHSLDSTLGWQNLGTNGISAPFTSLLSLHAVALQATGVVLGPVDLSACRDF